MVQHRQTATIDGFQALVGRRTRLHVGVRVGVRMWLVAAPSGWAGSLRGARVMVGGAGDVLTAFWLSRNDALGWWRLAADCAEAAVWAATAADTNDAGRPAFMPSIPLALEAGARMGPVGIVVPAVLTATVAAVRAAKGHRLRLGQAAWPALSGAGGWALAGYQRGRLRQLMVERDGATSAGVAAAFRAGPLDAAAAADSVIDEVQRACLLMEDAGGPSLRAAVATWKASLAETIRHEAVYLLDALWQWQALRNMHADLSTAVRFDIDPTPPVILTRRQAAELWQCLDELAPRGPVSVEVIDPVEAARPGGQRRLRIGAHELVLAPDERPSWLIDVSPLFLALAGVRVACSSFPDLGAVPLAVTLPAAAGYGTAAIWGHRRLVRRGLTVRPGIAAAALAIAAPYAVAATLTSTSGSTSAGLPQFPVAGALQGLLFVLGSVNSSLTARQRQLVATAVTSIGLAAWACSPNRSQWRALVADGCWIAAAAIAVSGLTESVDANAEALAQSLDAADEALVHDAFGQGRQSAADLAASYAAAAECRLRDIGSRLEPRVRAEAIRRLSNIADRVGSSNKEARPCES
jgi:hypothetical protein